MVTNTATAYFPAGKVSGQFLDNGRHLELDRELIFADGDLRVVVADDFVTDFNSVPRGLWNFFPPWEYPEAGVVHDWLYQHPGGRRRATIDAIHRRIMEIEGAGRIKRTLAYLGIRAGGNKPWDRYRAQGLQ